jgi:hypothetical protein
MDAPVIVMPDAPTPEMERDEGGTGDDWDAPFVTPTQPEFTSATTAANKSGAATKARRIFSPKTFDDLMTFLNLQTTVSVYLRVQNKREDGALQRDSKVMKYDKSALLSAGTISGQGGCPARQPRTVT